MLFTQVHIAPLPRTYEYRASLLRTEYSVVSTEYRMKTPTRGWFREASDAR